MRFFATILALLGLSAGGFWLSKAYLGVSRANSTTAERFVLVAPGDNFTRVGKKLFEDGLIRDERYFRWYLRLTQSTGALKVGEYALRENMSIAEIVEVLSSGKSVQHKFTVYEGDNKFQIAAALEAARLGVAKTFLAEVDSPDLIRDLALPTVATGVNSVRSLEGYLYPDTYLLTRLMSEREIVRAMVKRFKQGYANIAAEVQAKALSLPVRLSPHEIVVLASMVEKETGAGKERPLIASVFYNRLTKGMRLQSDPTTIYGIWNRDRVFDGNIRRADLRTETPYNTYTVPRLPAGPIANPGDSAFQAVLNPASSEFLYFVAKNDGTHVFTTNYRDHQRAVDLLQKNPSVREGKSWRNLPASERAR
mgnify:CR=1 FL=1